MHNFKIILGSASPRRKELLEGLDLAFEVDTTSYTDEHYDICTPHALIPETLAKIKSDGFHRALCENEILITADTMVFGEDNGHEAILGKPKDREDAYIMLRLLSGKTHFVRTGVCVRDLSSAESFTSTSEVTFRELSDSEIYYYIDTYKPYDKAGAYGIQEWIGYIGITSIKGSYYNIMGLPVQELYELLRHKSQIPHRALSFCPK